MLHYLFEIPYFRTGVEQAKRGLSIYAGVGVSIVCCYEPVPAGIGRCCSKLELSWLICCSSEAVQTALTFLPLLWRPALHGPAGRHCPGCTKLHIWHYLCHNQLLFSYTPHLCSVWYNYVMAGSKLIHYSCIGWSIVHDLHSNSYFTETLFSIPDNKQI